MYGIARNVLFLGFLSCVFGQPGQPPLVNRAVYTFQNKADFGFLTSVGSKARVVITDQWTDNPGQKWRIIKGIFGSSFMLKPTSQESDSIFVDGHMVSRASSGFGLSSSQYWTVTPAKGDPRFFTVRNSNTEECLESRGLGSRVMSIPCRSDLPTQQWAIHRR